MSQLIKIALVDDDQDACELIKLQLESTERFQVSYTTQPGEAEKLVADQKSDLVILDINMPDRHGVEIASILSAKPETASLPILYLSGMVSPEEVLKFGGDEAHRTLISKGSPITELIGAIDRLIAG
ncbi:MAG: response regulator [Thermodesulfobacteriota bacterium]